jgi:hypothetical protein
MFLDYDFKFKTIKGLAEQLAAHYGGRVGLYSGSRVAAVELDGVKIAVISREKDPVGLFLFSGGRGMVAADGWSVGDAVGFIDRIRNAGGVAGVMSNDGVTFRYTLSVSVTVKAMKVDHVGALELVCLGLENAETGDEITGDEYDLIVDTCGPVADLRLSDELGVIS